MSIEVEVDGSFFLFPDGWQVEKVDQWNEQGKFTPSPIFAKACDLVAVSDSVTWLIEAKDYTYPGARVPKDLQEQILSKVWHTLALLHAVAAWGTGDHQEFSRESLKSERTVVCLAVELPDGGRRLLAVQTPLASLLDRIKPPLKKLGQVRPIVSNSFMNGGVPWAVRRDPAARLKHSDRRT